MKFERPPETAAFVDGQVRSGAFSRPDDVVVAALETFRADCRFGDFSPGESDRLPEEGERGGQDRGWCERDDARRELGARMERQRNSRQ